MSDLSLLLLVKPWYLAFIFEAITELNFDLYSSTDRMPGSSPNK
jgi:hypothetical protein